MPLPVEVHPDRIVIHRSQLDQVLDKVAAEVEGREGAVVDRARIERALWTWLECAVDGLIHDADALATDHYHGYLSPAFWQALEAA